MRTKVRTAGGMLCAAMIVGLVGGCQDPPYDVLKQNYENLDTQYRELQGRLAAAEMQAQEARDAQTGAEMTLAERNAKIDDLLRQIEELKERGVGTGDTPEGWEGTGAVVWTTVPGDLLFASGKASLKPTAAAKLATVASVIQNRYAGRDIYVVGHTDNDPIKRSGWKDNWELSCQRALAVARELIKRGVPADDVMAAGRGETKPRASNATPAGKAKNRRVEIYAVVSKMGD